MAEKLLTTEAIALTEKKMHMSLDDIIKMSKKNTFGGKRPPRLSNKSRGFQNIVASQKNSKVKKFMDSRSSIRQGVLAKRRTNFQANQFPLTIEVARKAAVTPIPNRVINYKLRVAGPSVQRNVVEGTSDGKDSASVKPRSQTLDALFANLKQRRMMNKQIPSGDKSANPRSRRHRQLRQERERLGAPLKRPVAGARCLAPSGCWHRLAPGSRLPASGGRHPAPGIQPRLAADTSGVRRRSTAGVIRRLAPSGRRLAPSGYQRSASGAQRRPAIGAVQKLTLGGQ